MRANNALALIFTNSSDNALPELTSLRAMASVPFGGRYRIIDFHLSSLVNSGVARVGIIPRSNYRSLMDHIGSGKPWDLDRKYGGLVFLPPFITSASSVYKGHISAIENVRGFIEKFKEEYIILCDADVVCNIDIEKMFTEHVKTNSDVTVAYKHGELPNFSKEHLVFSFDENNNASEVLLSKDSGKLCDFSLGTMIFSKSKLLELTKEAYERGFEGIGRGILQRNRETLKIHGFEITGFSAPINNMDAYVKANMELLNPDIRKELLGDKKLPVYTKTREDCPTKYGLQSEVKNSLIADGCIIEGKVENCILFRGVKIGKGSVVKNSIIMQSTVIGENCDIKYLIADKDVTVSDESKLTGAECNYFLIKKGGKV